MQTDYAKYYKQIEFIKFEVNQNIRCVSAILNIGCHVLCKLIVVRPYVSYDAGIRIDQKLVIKNKKIHK